VLATRGTLASAKFHALHGGLAERAQFHLVACDGLASAIERDDAAQIDTLAARYLHALGPLGTRAGQIDTLVLGCTHYPFATAVLRRYASTEICLLDTGAPVAQQTRRLLTTRGTLHHDGPGTLTLESSGQPQAAAVLRAAAARWLGEYSLS
jgi:glutamate racemase